MEDRAIDMEVDGIRFISHGHYYDGINNWLCHKLKENDPLAITYCARQLVKMLPENAVIVPIPGHFGYAVQTLYLARAISEQSKRRSTTFQSFCPVTCSFLKSKFFIIYLSSYSR